MNTEQFTSVCVALACIASLGVASTTLDSSLSTDPDDIVTFDYGNLPITGEDAVRIDRAIASTGDEAAEASAGTQGESGEVRESSAVDAEADGQASKPSRSEQVAASRRSGAEQRQADGGRSDRRRAQNDEQSEATPPDLVDRLLSLLSALLPWIALAALAGGILYRYRERLGAALGDRGTDAADVEPKEVPAPDGDIERAWLAMVEAASVDRPRSKTPAECAAAAVETGLDPESVETLRRTFEEVRYGDGPLTDEHRRRAARARRHLDLDSDRRGERRWS